MIQSLNDLRAEIDELHRLGVSAEYAQKQLHKIPVAPVVNRVEYILEKCKNKRVLHLGCGWPPGYLHESLGAISMYLEGVDFAVPNEKEGYCGEHRAFYCVNFDDRSFFDFVVSHPDVDVVVCAEILEHLGNPGNFLKNVKSFDCPVVITVPNSFSRGGYYSASGGIENVNRQHVAYYSYWTLRELVTRYGYVIEAFCWYNKPKNGQPQESEGLIMLVR